jgi:hypothetical protein
MSPNFPHQRRAADVSLWALYPNRVRCMRLLCALLQGSWGDGNRVCIFRAHVLNEVRIGKQQLWLRIRYWPRVRYRIVDRNFDVHPPNVVTFEPLS